MNKTLLAAPLVAVALFAAACGGGSSSSTTTSANPSLDPAVFKKNAELYSQNLKSYLQDLTSCATGALTSGSASKQLGMCMKQFATSVTTTSKALKTATDQYLKGVSGPCRTSIKSFSDSATKVGDAFSKVASSGDGSSAVSAAISTLGDPTTQKLITDSQSAFNGALKACADLANTNTK